jgi:hypothetical protein
VLCSASAGKTDSSLSAESNTRRCPEATSTAQSSVFPAFPVALLSKKLICFESGVHAIPRVKRPLKLGSL